VTGPTFDVGPPSRTVLTPTDPSGTGAPERSFAVIHEFFGVLRNVADAAPGDPSNNGGRWAVHGLTFSDDGAAVASYDANGSGDLDSDEEVRAAIAGGAATDLGVIKRFVCLAIPLPQSP
jgi:hypothetical protein